MLALTLTCCWMACPAGVAAPNQDAALEESFAAAVDQERLLRTVRELVAIGPRMGGTPSGDLAAKHHAKLFREAGLEPHVTVDPELRAFQPLECSARVTVGEETLELKDGTLALRTLGIDATELPLRTTDGEPAATNESYARLVNEGELSGLGKLTGSGAPRVLLVGCERRIDSSTPILRQPGGFAGTLLTVSKREARWLRERQAGGILRLAIAAKVFDAPGKPLTISANIAGTTADAPVLMFCAHGDSDSGGPGADDNASGDAVVHELAAVFAKLARDDGMALPITLRFIVWGSEIHSSRAWLDRIRADGSAARYLAVINFDQAGTGAERDCIYFEPDNLKLNEPLVRLGLAMAGDYAGDDGFWSEYTSNAALGGTDSYVFSPGWQRGGAKGDLPAITLFSAAFGSAEEPAATPGFDSPGWKGDRHKVRVDYSRVYHETGDRAELTTDAEPWNMPWVTKAAGLLGLRLAASPDTVKKLLTR